MTTGFISVYVNMQMLLFVTAIGLFQCSKDFSLSACRLCLWKDNQNYPNVVLREEEVKSEDSVCSNFSPLIRWSFLFYAFLSGKWEPFFTVYRTLIQCPHKQRGSLSTLIWMSI